MQVVGKSGKIILKQIREFSTASSHKLLVTPLTRTLKCFLPLQVVEPQYLRLPAHSIVTYRLKISTRASRLRILLNCM
jgi:hypothetical protein